MASIFTGSQLVNFIYQKMYCSKNTPQVLPWDVISHQIFLLKGNYEKRKQ